ncbi:MAG: chemotaxis protein CheW, partial [Pseudomonadota bacterium]
YITFSLEEQYALEINEVKEVIDLPEKVMTPPNLSPLLKGMINLRGDMIPVIDPRTLYTMGEQSAASSQKIMIFKIEDGLCGLIVDTVDSILTFPDDQKVKIPSLIYKREETSMNEDLKEALQIQTQDGGEVTLLILDLNSVCERVAGSKAA